MLAAYILNAYMSTSAARHLQAKRLGESSLTQFVGIEHAENNNDAFNHVFDRRSPAPQWFSLQLNTAPDDKAKQTETQQCQ